MIWLLVERLERLKRGARFLVYWSLVRWCPFTEILVTAVYVRVLGEFKLRGAIKIENLEAKLWCVRCWGDYFGCLINILGVLGGKQYMLLRESRRDVKNRDWPCDGPRRAARWAWRRTRCDTEHQYLIHNHVEMWFLKSIWASKHTVADYLLS